MKKQNILYIVAFMAIIIPVQAQENKNSLNREVTIEKDFTPIVRDASKINVLPEVETPSAVKQVISYSDWTFPSSVNPQIPVLPAYGYADTYKYSKKRGYIDYALGNYWNMTGSAGYRILDSKQNKLGVWFQHNSANGIVKYLQNDEKRKQKWNDNRVGLYYNHRFNTLQLNIDGGYRYNTFNYYGYQIPLAADNKNQVAQQVNIKAGIKSLPDAEDFEYDISVGYNRYSNKLGLFLFADEGKAQNHFSTKFRLGAPVNEISKIGIDGGMDNLFYSKNYSEYGSFTVIRLTPYYSVKQNNINLRLGMNMDISANDGTIFRFAPDVRLDWEFYDSNFLYTSITGGKKIFTWDDLANITRYFYSVGEKSSYTPVDAVIGFGSRAIPGVSFNLYGGYENVKDKLVSGGLVQGHKRPAVGFFNLDRAACWKLGIEVRYNYISWLEINAKVDFRSWDNNEVLYTPKWEGALDVKLHPVKPLTLYAGYNMATGRKYIWKELNPLDSQNAQKVMRGTLKNIHNVKVGASYTFGNDVTLFAQVDNLLNRRYEYYYGMPAQRLNFMAGFAVNF